MLVIAEQIRSKPFQDFLRLPHKVGPRGALLDAKVIMRIDSTSLSLERYQMLRAQTSGNFRISEVFVTSDDEVATNPRVQAWPPRSLTHSEGNGGASIAPPTDSLDMRQAHN